ncbi:hypothetical protein KOW79_022273 [Hemibagrus wyckioides]|uniref:Uncharacterized protein n=1 Tax=Hemibagrus wyckioides TaxID=337641 RepID=A0A9D3N5P0_9TELE|nr:hypothetical protein KOW79_022273 [Hemibagrus wyckioides]
MLKVSQVMEQGIGSSWDLSGNRGGLQGGKNLQTTTKTEAAVCSQINVCVFCMDSSVLLECLCAEERQDSDWLISV